MANDHIAVFFERYSHNSELEKLSAFLVKRNRISFRLCSD